MALAPRAVVVQRTTELDDLLARHGTRRQAAFFLAGRGRDLDDVERRHALQRDALIAVAGAIPVDWRRGEVERDDLARFVFGPEDVIVAVGQDGLVANVAKYLDGQVVIGVNPDPERNPGVLVPHPPGAAPGLLREVATGALAARVEPRTMVSATLDDGQQLQALNELYVGHPSHQSARYRLETADGARERQSSSGVLIGTGTGATGWCRSVALERHSALALPEPAQPALCWFVREAWPSPVTGTTFTEGLLEVDQQIRITAETDLVVFGDGIEGDALHLTWGQQVTLQVARQHLALVT